MQGNLVMMSAYVRSPARTDSGGKIGEAQRRKSINVLDLMCQTEVLLVLICHHEPICKSHWPATFDARFHWLFYHIRELTFILTKDS